MAPTINGILQLPPVGLLDVQVALEDITMQDAAALVVAETRLTSVKDRASFALEVPESAVRPSRVYTLAARACSPGGSVPRAGTVAVHRWMPPDESPQIIDVRDFRSSEGDLQ